MNLSRCPKGHFYDAEKYSSCPHCGGGAGADDSLTAAFTEDMTVPDSSAAPKAVAQSAPVAAPQPVPAQTFPQIQPVAPAPMPQFPVANIPADQVTVPMQGLMAGEDLTSPLTMPQEIGQEPAKQPQPAAVEDNDHTVGFYDVDFFSDAGTQSQTPTPSQPQPAPKPVNMAASPCVGWLVALGGNHLGMDFRLKVGKNFIGRSPQMDVALVNDKSVSRDKQAIVVYEPREHLYLVQPGEASTLVYKNETVVLEATRLEAYDVITVGDVNLLFIPLCNKEFNWSDLLDSMRKGN